MTSYIYSKWRESPVGCPVEFFSELDASRFETRKLEIFRSGRIGFASTSKSTHGTRLGIEPVPPIHEIRAQPEFEIKEISKAEFEQEWQKATGRK